MFFKKQIYHIINISPKEARELASKMLGHKLVTHQTGGDGVLVSKVMIAESLNFSHEQEKYFAILLDRASQGPVLVGSPDGGVDIEAVAQKTPDRIFRQPVDINKGVEKNKLVDFAKKLGFKNVSVVSTKLQIEKEKKKIKPQFFSN